MPDAENKLTNEEQAQTRRWLEEKGAMLPCPACGNQDWSVGEHLAIAPAYAPGVLKPGGYPLVLLLCTRCTFMRWHSAMMVGLVPIPNAGADKTSGTKAEG